MLRQIYIEPKLSKDFLQRTATSVTPILYTMITKINCEKKGRNLPQFYKSVGTGALFLKRDALWQRAHQGVTGWHTTQRARQHTAAEIRLSSGCCHYKTIILLMAQAVRVIVAPTQSSFLALSSKHKPAPGRKVFTIQTIVDSRGSRMGLAGGLSHKNI